MRTNKGFTLIELLVVVSIIALLSSVILSGLNQAKLRAQAIVIRQNFDQLQKAMVMYQNANNGRVIREMVLGIDNGLTTKNRDDLFYETLQPLVDGEHGKFISSIVKNPVYPDNNNDTFLRFVYTTEHPYAYTKNNSPSYYFTCGSKPWGSYTLIVWDPSGKYGKFLGMDRTVYYQNDEIASISQPPYNGLYSYCVTNS